MFKILFTFYKTSYLNEEVNSTETSPQLELPVVTNLPILRVIPDHDIFVMVNGLSTVEHLFKLVRSANILYFVFLTKRRLTKLVGI